MHGLHAISFDNAALSNEPRRTTWPKVEVMGGGGWTPHTPWGRRGRRRSSVGRSKAAAGGRSGARWRPTSDAILGGAGRGRCRLVGQAEPPRFRRKGQVQPAARARHGTDLGKGAQALRDIPLNTLRPFGIGMGITGLTPAPFPQTQPRGVDPSGPDSGGEGLDWALRCPWACMDPRPWVSQCPTRGTTVGRTSRRWREPCLNYSSGRPRHRPLWSAHAHR